MHGARRLLGTAVRSECKGRDGRCTRIGAGAAAGVLDTAGVEIGPRKRIDRTRSQKVKGAVARAAQGVAPGSRALGRLGDAVAQALEQAAVPVRSDAI